MARVIIYLAIVFCPFQNEIFRLAIKHGIIPLLQNCTPILPWHASCNYIMMTAAPERGY